MRRKRTTSGIRRSAGVSLTSLKVGWKERQNIIVSVDRNMNIVVLSQDEFQLRPLPLPMKFVIHLTKLARVAFNAV